MREIRCAFGVVRLVHTTSVNTDTIKFYIDSPTVYIDIVHDYLKLFWGCRNEIAYINITITVDGERVKMFEEHVKGMIDSTLNQCDGSIPQTVLQMSLLIDKVKQIKRVAGRMKPGNLKGLGE